MKIRLVIAFIISISGVTAFSQEDSLRENMTNNDSANSSQTEKVQIQTEKPDTLICGKEYKIRAANGWKGKAVLIAQDSLTITIKLGHKNIKILKDQISEMVTSDKHFKSTVSTSINLLDKCNIALAGGKVIKGALIKKLSNDTLVIIKKSTDVRIPVDDITSIVFPKESNAFIIGVGSGAVCALGTMLIMETNRPDYSNQFLGNMSDNLYTGTQIFVSLGAGVLGGLASGLIAGSVSADDVYDLSGMNKETKLCEIGNIIEGSE